MTLNNSELRESLGAFIDSDGVTILCLDGSELRLSATMEIDLFNRIEALIDKQVIEGKIEELQTMLDRYQVARDIMYEEIKKHGFEVSISIKAVELMIKNLQDRLATLKDNLKDRGGE